MEVFLKIVWAIYLTILVKSQLLVMIMELTLMYILTHHKNKFTMMMMITKSKIGLDLKITI